jgi:hypothetical protein
MRSRSVIKSLPVVAALGAAALAAGCSSGGSAPTPQQAVLLAVQHAAAVNSISGTMSVTATGKIAVTASGSMTVQVRPQLLAQVTIPSIQAAGQSLPGGMTEDVTDQAIYIRSSVFGSIDGGKPWIEVPFGAMGASGNALSTLLQQEQNSNPLDQTRLLAGATGVREIGTSEINGVPVTEYTGQFTIAAALAKLPASDRQAVKQQIAQSGVTGGGFTVWLDGQQQVRKLVMTEHADSLNMTITMVVDSMNQPVNIQLPPASQVKVFSASQLLGS